MGRLSRGCRRCRERRVRCDEGRPACRRCVNRSEVCEGYRDTASLIFRHETDKVIEHAQQAAMSSQSQSSSSYGSSSRRRSHSVDASPSSASSARRLLLAPPNLPTHDVLPHASALAPDDAEGVPIDRLHPWLKAPQEQQPPAEDQAVHLFLDKYVLYPCNQTSTPGFLEHLPSMFKEVDNISGRHALRWSVQAAAYADLSKQEDSKQLARKALHCYGMALKALGESLAAPGKQPDDYDLMTVVILDMFETLYKPEERTKGAHGQGMAQILRLRGKDLVYNARGWSLFRLAHHRIQLAYNMPPLPESTEWLNQLNPAEPSARLEGIAHEISETCERARSLLELINVGGFPAPTVVDMILELRALDQAAVRWRQTPHRSFTEVSLQDRPDLRVAAADVTDKIQLHSDLWMAYEWNYHRAARIIFLQQLLKCSYAALEAPDLDDTDRKTLQRTVAECAAMVQWLADEVFATVPQSFGDVDQMGHPHDYKNGAPRCRGIGGYLLLWPIKIAKGPEAATTLEQKARGERVFERIREYTGMKAELGDKSII
ncbi:hypothetical protein SEUCBS139899_008979 [Sporothrix eucalyptigena]